MRVAILSLAAFVALAAAAIPGLPSCASNCVSSDFGGCGSLNVTCICENQPLIAGLACCVSTSCDAADQATTIQFADSLCAGYGIKDLPSSATCAPGAASTVASGSTSSGTAVAASSSAVSSAISSASSAAASASSSAASKMSSGTSGSGSTTMAATSTTGSGSSTTAAAAATTSASASASAKSNGNKVEAGMSFGALLMAALAAL